MSILSTSPRKTDLPRAALLAAVLILTAGAAMAQGGLSFGGMRGSQDAPVEFRADNLSVNNATGESVLSGNAVIAQGDMRMAAPEIRIFFTPGAQSRITRVEGLRGVTLVTAQEAAEAQSGVYDLTAGVVRLTGSVMVTQGPNIITGDRLVVNVDTGAGTMEGNVRSVIQNTP
jgi:lipopolysaccharide export system protein LptA